MARRNQAGQLNCIERMVAFNPGYTNLNPLTAGRISTMKAEDKRYIAHDFFNSDWQPMSFFKHESMAKMDYVGLAYYLSPILDCLADHKIKTILQIQQAVHTRGINLGKLYKAIIILTGANHIVAVLRARSTYFTRSESTKR